ncbi:YqaA family protein [Echinimonas agarilytica]|uniref:VTT domain-containing protein n=1 Tax=Echinimonas agarilytica TaxID=1215918 RepID=A0AA42B6Z5_9GAMM|nr:VTT domain-containing protein [Echinimonas agarilytica]MCM2679299.1 VTT domain-containing protein [Echinimonas agarilytica]
MTVFGLFLTSLLAATLLPGGSEAALLAAHLNQWAPTFQLFIAATLGNTIGGLITFWMGIQAARYRTPEQLAQKNQQLKYLTYVRRWGAWALLFSWLPIVGDIICLAAGWLKLPYLKTAIAMFIGKAARYAIILLMASPFIAS